MSALVVDSTVEFPNADKQLSPEDLANRLCRGLVTRQHWDGVEVQLYRRPTGEIEVELPPLRDHMLVVHLEGETLVEERGLDGDPLRRWTHQGQISMTPAGQPVSRLLKGRSNVILIHIAPDKVRAVAKSVYADDANHVALVPRLAVPDENVEQLGRLLLSEAETRDPGAAFVANMLASSLAVHLLRYHSTQASGGAQRLASPPGGRFRQIIEHMQAHLEDTLPLTVLADMSGLSLAQFARAFRAATGKPPHRYLTWLRVARASELLERTDRSVIEIGFQCGFEQASHFATAFRRATGMSPREWRISHRS
ncbi:AraC family transcriptional regulator [Paraburkholderia xenovorans]|uniref:helix-turn-helix domain-containing protein n=1 Tax=Paraburkholderia xenovorans TaxID=36873 RepID=UPI0038BD0E39